MKNLNHSYKSHKHLYQLLKETNLMEMRHELVMSYSQGRTENSALLYPTEIKQLIDYLKSIRGTVHKPQNDFEAGDKMRKKILSLCYTIGWVRFSAHRQKMVVDMARLEAWMKKYGYLHKSLNDYKYNELPELVSQFERMAISFLEPQKHEL